MIDDARKKTDANTTEPNTSFYYFDVKTRAAYNRKLGANFAVKMSL